MRFPSLLVLSIGLAMDAAAVSASRGFVTRQLRLRHYALVAVFFGGSQALMPLLGWQLGTRLGPWLGAWDHWIAFVLLGGIGAKMIHEARHADPEARATVQDAQLFGLRVMALLAFATSLDAFAVGITLPMLGAPMLMSLLVIGLTTAILSALSLAAGHHFGNRLGSRLDAFGGVVLMLLGTKILVQHLGQ